MRPPPRRPAGPGPLSWLFILGVLGVALVLPLDRGEAMRHARAHIQERFAHLLDPQKPRTERPTGEKRVWEGIRILAPSRPGAEVRGRFTVELDNPKGLPAEVSIVNLQDSSQESCP